MDWHLRGERVHIATGSRPFLAGRPSVVFLHGSSLDHRIWDGCTQEFAERGYAMLAPDLPGHGRSRGEPLVSIEDMADWLHELVQSAGAGRLSLVGHSQGALVGLEFAARFGKEVASLSCIASGMATPVNPALLKAAQDDPPSAVAMMLAWGFAPPESLADPALPRRMEAWMGANARRALAVDLRACDGYRNGSRAVAAIHCPTQVVVGELDRMAPAAATDALIAALNRPRVDRLPNSGHMLPVEKPRQCGAAVRAFISRHNPPSPVGGSAAGDPA